MNREKRRSQALPENYDEIVGEAIQLKREVPRRSIRQIIKILETEGYAPPGVIKASTLQRYLYNAGLGVKQMKRYAEKGRHHQKDSADHTGWNCYRETSSMDRISGWTMVPW